MERHLARQAARFLLDEHQAGARFKRLPTEFRPETIEEAYDVQEEFQRLLSEERNLGPVAGYKVAAISPVMQRLLGIHHPCAGAIFERTIWSGPACLKPSDFAHLAIECEIAVTLARDLIDKGSPYTREDVAHAVSSCSAAIELVEDRHADYTSLTAIDLIADNSWNAGVVIGATVVDWQALDLATIRGVMTINGHEVGWGVAGDIRGHPFESVAWLANMLLRRGRTLRRGTMVMTGSIIETQFPAPGDEVRVSVEGLGDAAFRFG